MESGIQETFARGIRNLKNICSWKLTGIEKIFARGIRNLEKTCSWNPESREHLLVESVMLFFYPFFSVVAFPAFLPITQSLCLQ